jgi:hypothetical protein
MYTLDAATVDYVLKGNFENYIKGPDMKHDFEDFLGDGIFNADGHTWKHQR